MPSDRETDIGGTPPIPAPSATPEPPETPRSTREAERSIEAQVRADVGALISGHPMGEALAAMAYSLAAKLDGDLQHMAVAGINRELRETLLELARLGVNDDDDLDAQLSRPRVPSEVQHRPQP